MPNSSWMRPSPRTAGPKSACCDRTRRELPSFFCCAHGLVRVTLLSFVNCTLLLEALEATYSQIGMTIFLSSKLLAGALVNSLRYFALDSQVTSN